eukprot:2109522-Rhodomonas_salina.1
MEATSLLQDVTHLELTQRDLNELGPSTGTMTIMKAGPEATAYIEKGYYEHALDCKLLTVRGTYLHAVPAFGLSKGYIDASTAIALEDEARLQFVYWSDGLFIRIPDYNVKLQINSCKESVILTDLAYALPSYCSMSDSAVSSYDVPEPDPRIMELMRNLTL